MDINPLDAVFAAEDPRVDATPAPEAAPAPEAVESAPERPRNADGTFAAAPVDAPSEATPAPTPVKDEALLSEKETVGFYKTMMEERDRRQAAERRAADLEARLRIQAPPSEPPPPDVQRRMDNFALRFDISQEFATRHYGPELTATIHQWAQARCDADPHFNQQMLAARLPFEAAKEAYDREQILAEVKTPDDLAAFRAWQAERSADPAPPQPTPTDPVPTSLVTAPGTGSRGQAHVETGEDSAYKAAFGA